MVDARKGLRALDLHREYKSADRTLSILRGVEVTLSAGESVAIVGRSGAGKSTLLHLLGLLDSPTRGSIEMGGENATAGGRRLRDRLRREFIGFVFQFYHLLPELTAVQNVMMSGMVGSGTIAWLRHRAQHRQRAEELLERVGLADRMHHSPSKLSGGERQRVAIARALYRDPALLLCDEPTGNLDEQTSAEVEELLLALQAERGTMMVLVTHNLRLAEQLDRVLLLEAGKLHDVQGKLDQAGSLADMIR